MAVSRDLMLAGFAALASLILVISTASDSWASLENCVAGQCISVNYGMFTWCVSGNGQSICGSFPQKESWQSACQFFAVAACILAIPTAIYMFLVATGRRVPMPTQHESKAPMIATGVLALVTICTLACFAIFASQGLTGVNASWGFIMMIVACIFFAIITIGFFASKHGTASVGESDALFPKQ